MNTLFLIIARGGSKGLPSKNIRKVAGIPMIGYKAISARQCDYCTRLIASTDSEEIADVALEYGSEVPFIRPDYLATDTTSSMDVVIHAMNWIEKNDTTKYDALFLLQPSSPFATYEDFNRAVRLMLSKKAIGVISVVEQKTNSMLVANLDPDGGMSNFYKKINAHDVRRQAFKKEYTMNGGIYVASWEYLKKFKTFHSDKTYAYIMPQERSLDIDSLYDLKLAEFLAREVLDVNKWWGGINERYGATFIQKSENKDPRRNSVAVETS
jgi:CMP-N,N'-diacetyllegionaminic acid synthase